MHKRIPLLLMCLAAPAAATVFMAPVDAYTLLKLTPGERREVEQVACMKPHQMPLDSAIGLGGADQDHTNMRVHVRCAPHEKLGRHRVLYSSICEKKGEEITCTAGKAVLHADLGGRRVQVTVGQPGISMREALDIVVYVDSLGMLKPEQEDLFDERDSPFSKCEIVSKAGDTFDVECDDSSISVLAIRSPGGVQYRRVEAAPTS